MLARHQEPIVAIATAPGRGAVGIVRVSGRHLTPLIHALCGRTLKPREATYLHFADADGSPIDHNFCLAAARGAIRPVAWLTDQASGVSLEVRTTEPGLQVYDGSRVNIAVPGHGGAKMGASCGIALEPQVWPDANHHPAFPQAVLVPGEDYVQHTQYVFTKDTP